MMRLFRLLPLLATASAGGCAPEDTLVGTKCLFAVNEPDPKAAVAECAASCASRGLGGSILAPASAAEDDAGHAACVAGHYRFCYIGIVEARQTSTGGYELADDGDWHKIENYELKTLKDTDHQNWCPGEPNNGGGDQKIAGYCGDQDAYDMRAYCPDTTGCWHDVTPLAGSGAVCACDAPSGGGTPPAPAPAPAPAAAGEPPACPALSDDRAGTCFFVTPAKSFVDAHETCATGCAQRGRGGGLFVPSTSGEDRLGKDACARWGLGLCRFGVAEAETNSRGGISWKADGAWKAIAGRGEAQSLTYEHWCPGEPNNQYVSDEKAAAYGTWRPDACWVDVATDGGDKTGALCRCEGAVEEVASSKSSDASGASAATIAAIVGWLLLLCAIPLALYGALAMSQGAKVVVPCGARTAPADVGGVTFSPLAEDDRYRPPVTGGGDNPSWADGAM